MRSRYDTMQKSTEVKDEEFDEYYYDPMTFPVNLFTYTQTTVQYPLTKQDIHRIDSTMSTYYGKAEFDDIVLWLNDIPFLWDEEPGREIELPRRRDLERFFTQFTR